MAGHRLDVRRIQHACPGAAPGKESRSCNELEQPRVARKQAAWQSTVQASADAAADEEVDYDEADDWDED